MLKVCILSTFASTCIFLAGCSPREEMANVRLSVVDPSQGGPSQDGMTGEFIDPPSLAEVRTQGQSVAMRIGETLVQNQAPIEIIPTPEPDAVPAKSPLKDTQDPGKNNPKAEMVPAPIGEPLQAAGPNLETGPEMTSPKTGEQEGQPIVPVDSQMTDPNDPAVGATGPEDYHTWKIPPVALVVTGRQHGYIEPCGCTGLERQKGGVARRYTFMNQLRKSGWSLLPVDGGDQVRRFGRQSEIKLQQTARALKEMGYVAVGFGPDDLRLGVGELLSVAAAGDSPEKDLYLSSNVVLIDDSLMPSTKVIQRNGLTIGFTSALDPATMNADISAEIEIREKTEQLRIAQAKLAESNPNFSVLLYFGTEESAKEIVKAVPGFDLVVAAGSYGEPTYRAEQVEGTKTRMIVTGNKGMYAGLVGIYEDEPMKYARVALTHEFGDAPEMRQLMREYQDQLKKVGLEELGLLPAIPHSSGQKFVGTAKCGECHTTALDIWEGTPHAEATDHIVKPPKERGDVARHFDPECISCHVTGWNPQEYYPYASGYLSLDESPHLLGNGCENCHGPGSGHAEAEADGSTVSQELRDQLRESMKLPLEKAREKCMTCHDLDNSPDFHEEDAFEDIYWPEVEHYGKD